MLKKWITGLFLIPCLAAMLMFAGNAIAASKVVIVTGIAEN